MIDRTIENRLQHLSGKYPIVTLVGPRQSGKSTLLRNAFSDYRYVSLEDLDMREFALNDPRGFLSTYSSRVIIDEAQNVPSLFSYLQTHVDLSGDTGMYFLSGSHNFLMMERISQSLSGRTAILKLLPFSHAEMSAAGVLPSSVDDEIFQGCYPRLYDKNLEPRDFYPHYISTYVERDVRQLKNIGNLNTFVLFVKLCAGRIGQLLNISSLANECGISVPTATSWLSVLEASFICYTLRPDWNNFNKRLVKTPKLYFYDTGLACSLLDIASPTQLSTHYLRGGLFENMVINEVVKRNYNDGIEPDLRFWRDSQGNEVDLLEYDGQQINAYEMKSSATFSTGYFKGLNYLAGLSENALTSRVVYCGETSITTSHGELVAWNDF